MSENNNNFELILINDGSTDNTQDILDEISKNNIGLKIIIFSQENKGVSHARNKGIELSSGEIIVFLDSDDIFSFGYIEYLQKLFEDNDLDVVCCYRTNSRNTLFRYDRETVVGKYVKPVELLKEYTYSKRNIVFPCFSYKSSVIKNNNLLFSTDLRYGEDWEFVTKALSHCNKGYQIKEKTYWYRVSAKSASRKITWHQTDVIEAAKRSSDYLLLRNNEFAEEFSIYMYSRSLFSVLHRFASSNQNILYWKLIKEYDVRNSMNIILKSSSFDWKTKLAAFVFIVSPKLFYRVVK